MKRTLTMVFACVLVSAALFALGTANKKHKAVSIEEKPIIPVILGRQEPDQLDLSSNEFTKYVENLTGVEVQIETVAEDNLVNRVNDSFTAQKLPDAYMNVWLTNEHEEKYGVEQKQLLPLDSLIDKYMPHFRQALERNNLMKTSMIASDGHVYGLPGLNDYFHAQYQIKMWINKNALDKLGLPVPTTTEQFYQVLKAYKQSKPSGIPLTGAVDGWNTNVDSFLMNAFVLDTGMYNEFRTYVKDGRIHTIIDQEAYKEGLAYLNRLYAEGLLDPNSLTQKAIQLKQQTTSPEEPVLAVAAGSPDQFIDLGKNPEIARHYVALPPLKGPHGLKQSPFIPNYPLPMMFAIARTAKDPEALVRWADSFYTFDTSISRQYGVKGRDWTEESAGRAVKPRILQDRSSEQVRMATWAINGIYYNPVEWTIATDLDQTTKALYEPYSSKGVSGENPPPFKLTAAERNALQPTIVELRKYVDESRIRFIMGDLDVRLNWDAYVRRLDELGLKKVIDVYQRAYDRQMKS